MEQRGIVIGGGGPVGLGLAIDLGQRGIDVLVLERSLNLHNIPKGQNLTQRTGEHFQAWGVAEAMTLARPIPATFGDEGMTTYGTILGDYRYDWHRRKDVREYYNADNLRIPQYGAEAILRARCDELESIEVRYGARATEVTQDADRAVVTYEDDDGVTGSVSATYVVGCDGARSLVREQAGIQQDFTDNRNRMCLIVFRSTELHDLLQRHPGKSYFNAVRPEHKGYWLFLGRVDLGRTWFFHAPVPLDATRDNFDFEAFLHDAVGAEFAMEFDYVGFWDLRISHAQSYRSGRLFIAGDAAHSHPPYGGYGVNTGFEDARNLAWKLAADMDGWAGPGLLDSYGAERHPVFASTAEDFIRRMIREDGAFVNAFDPAKDRAAFEAKWRERANSTKKDVAGFNPNYAGSPVVVGGSGESGALAAHSHRATPGYHLTPHRLADGGNVYDHLAADRFTLLSAGADAADAAAFAEAVGRSSIPLQIVDAASEDAATWRAKLILVRPDNYVAFAADRLTGDADDILGKAAGY